MTGVVLYPINEEAISGSYLVAEIELTEATLEWCMGIWDLSDWRLQLDLSQRRSTPFSTCSRNAVLGSATSSRLPEIPSRQRA